ncbi:hypothetical protein HRbin37_02435 [bacterium HR37]|nr:hypothetical protein HRbin37_02435 [bacterium HR37]
MPIKRSIGRKSIRDMVMSLELKREKFLRAMVTPIELRRPEKKPTPRPNFKDSFLSIFKPSFFSAKNALQSGHVFMCSLRKACSTFDRLFVAHFE